MIVHPVVFTLNFLTDMTVHVKNIAKCARPTGQIRSVGYKGHPGASGKRGLSTNITKEVSVPKRAD